MLDEKERPAEERRTKNSRRSSSSAQHPSKRRKDSNKKPTSKSPSISCYRMRLRGVSSLSAAGGRRRRAFNVPLVLATILLSMVIFSIFIQDQQVDCKKLNLKDKKILKSLVKGLILNNLSNKKNLLPNLPVPIPVPIKLSKLPAYLKRKPKKYMTTFRPAPPPTRQPAVKPMIVYQMPNYSPVYEYITMSPPSTSKYEAMLINGHSGGYDGGPSIASYNNNVIKNNNNNIVANKNKNNNANLESLDSSTKFNDFDDESGNYYLGVANKQRLTQEAMVNQRGLTNSNKMKLSTRRAAEETKIMSFQDEETFDDATDSAGPVHKRVKRQIYHQSSYENEEPCYGFPLEINIKSRIKMDQLFPIKGNSQFKKCVKFRPLLPPVEDDQKPYY